LFLGGHGCLLSSARGDEENERFFRGKWMRNSVDYLRGFPYKTRQK
jgi:hypothetical protein